MRYLGDYRDIRLKTVSEARQIANSGSLNNDDFFSEVPPDRRATPAPRLFPLFDWTAERLAEVTDHVKNGLSRAAIAQIYGVTRNAVVGICYRHGITGPNNQATGGLIANDRKRRANQLRSSKRQDVQPLTTYASRPGKSKPAQHKLPPFPIPSDEPAPFRISLLDLSNTHCHWVCDGTDDYCLPTYCGHPSIDGRWCEHHYQRVYAR